LRDALAPRFASGLVESTKESAFAGTVVTAADAGACRLAIKGKRTIRNAVVARTALRIRPAFGS